jgi:hypothetical protein
MMPSGSRRSPATKDHAPGIVKVRAATREHDRVVIDVCDVCVPIMLPDELMDVALRGQAGSDVDELRDASFRDQEANCVLEEVQVF